MGEIAEIMLTDSQQRAFDKMTQFVHDEAKRVFILKGYAGTGKTTLMKILIGALKQENISFSFFIIYHLSRNMRYYCFYNLQFDKKAAQESAFYSSEEGNFLEIGVARAVFAGF